MRGSSKARGARRVAYVLAAFAATSPGPSTVHAQPAEKPSATTPERKPAGSAASKNRSATAAEIPFEKYTLPNGLEVILHRDRTLPLVAVNVWYHVGPANEPRGRSGFAHLFEHLMFAGSRHVGSEFDRLLEAVGGTNVNGTTSWDRTNYFQTVPRQHLELVLWIESDRMGYMLDTLTPDQLEVQRGVVQNERRQSYENSPYGPSTLALLDTLFPKGHPYHGAVIGSMADLSAASLDDVKAFFKSFYSPSNATLAIAGDYDEQQLKKLIERYFGTLPARPKPERVKHATPPLESPKRIVVKEPVKLAKVAFGYILPPAYGPDEAALEVTAAVLAGGQATRLYQNLVVGKQVATEVDASLESNELASLFGINALATSGKTPEQVEQALDETLTELERKGPSAAELARAKRRIFVDVQSNLQLLNGPGGESGRAGLLQRFNHYLGNPGYLPELMASIEQVTTADVQRVVRKHLGPKTRLSVVTVPSGPTSTP
ncbi:MAG TPA: pitrilysin family protein [Polyangiaceae bacterium]